MPSSSARSSRVPLPREIKVLVAAAFIIAIGFGIIAPLLPQYAATFDASAVGVAAVVSVFGLTRLLFAPVSGKLTNRLGETPVYMTGVLIVGNTSANNSSSVNFSIAAGNKVGTIVNAPASGAINGNTGGAGVGSTDPWANISY